MKVIKETIENYIFYIIPEEGAQAFYVKNKNYCDLLYMFGIPLTANYTKKQLTELLYANAEEYIEMYKKEYED